MGYVRKTVDEWEIQGYYGSAYGWETANTETTLKDARRSIKEYRENEPEYSFRLVKRRVKKEN